MSAFTGIEPANDGPGNEAYRTMRAALAQVQADEARRGSAR